MSTHPRAKGINIAPSVPVVRCAIYTRKSSDEGLDQTFNSLDAQRESAEAFIASQAGQGWVCLPDRYDDGGISGGTMDRPGLTRLLSDIEAGGIDAVIIYKLDRLTRSIRDFGRIMEVFEKHKVALVAVTQSLNTSTSMGRLMLHVLLSFAQFERELASERTRDKIAAARKKGMWSGGRPILGYDLSRCRLAVNEEESVRVREIFGIYIRLQSLEETAKELARRGWTTKQWKAASGACQGGRTFDKSVLHKLLTNVLYVGQVTHNGQSYPGEHEAIVERAVWDRAQQILQINGRSGGTNVRNRYGALLKGLLVCGACGSPLGHTYAVKNKTTVYRYYTCGPAKTGASRGGCEPFSIPAEQIETFVIEQIRHIGKDAELVQMVMDELNGQSDRKRQDLEAETRALIRERAWLEHRRTSAVRTDGPTELDALVLACEDKMMRLEAERSALAATRVSRERVERDLQSFDGMWAGLTPTEKASVLRLVLTSVAYDSGSSTVSIKIRNAPPRTDAQGDAA